MPKVRIRKSPGRPAYVYPTENPFRQRGLASTQSFLAPFKHTPIDLNTASIRLIEILPPSPNGTIQCNIRNATVDSEYTCLSYVWGSASHTNNILIDGKLFQVRRNLFEFLEMISAKQVITKQETTRLHSDKSPTFDLSHASRSLWIDAMCIDQENVVEKHHQVKQMGEIYSNAHCVLV
ncbi:HET-domain-containing protein [Cucurbitaria berberidis CBS 394.84]|uniref:HET-domain-containing protein n=1 Tax=Cucurbitaria berberidis CBS 394.84 TaxID=1168544 RepID=A0A9P4L691_9PLEO|nr:HET-domain-containing protein [Cucurbitaria berberidis CBS 394.84]KAF1843711.1 HET-domain-containing protein [Cucurbitaria berberidis CBS 394.84]